MVDGIREIAKGLPPLSRPALSKKSQDKEDEIFSLYEANKWWNYWKFQLNWKNIEWVNPRCQTKGINPFQFLQEIFSK